MGLSGWRVTQPRGSGIQLQQGFSSRLTRAFFFFFNLRVVLGSCIRQVVLYSRKWSLTFNSCSDFLFLLGIYIVSAGPLVLCSTKPVISLLPPKLTSSLLLFNSALGTPDSLDVATLSFYRAPGAFCPLSSLPSPILRRMSNHHSGTIFWWFVSVLPQTAQLH